MLVVGGQAGASAGFNVVPGSAWFSIDRRFNPEEDLDEELARLTGTIDEAAEAIGAKVEIEVMQAQPSGSSSQDHPAARTLAPCVEAVERAGATFQLCPGVLETRWYSELGIPAFAYGGGRLDVSHGPDEYIEEVAMRRCAGGLCAVRTWRQESLMTGFQRRSRTFAESPSRGRRSVCSVASDAPCL
jgi:acetylornithine deacetylase/succinyl-diaminopimelate desuccinylase-like protein